ncbi:MAG: hypothetical protein ACTH0S_06655 [Senegalia sp. (in: firmicutes)]
MISKRVEKEISKIEEGIKEHIDIIFTNGLRVASKFRGNKDLDVLVFFEDNESVYNEKEIKVFVGDEDSKVLMTYVVDNDKKLITTQKKYGNGNSRVYNRRR